jgi:hypothetical protein
MRFNILTTYILFYIFKIKTKNTLLHSLYFQNKNQKNSHEIQHSNNLYSFLYFQNKNQKNTLEN